MQTVVVTIGRNVGDEPMPADEWHSYAFETLRTVQQAVSELWANGPTRSVWGDVAEEARFYYGPVKDGPDVLRDLRVRLSTLATYHRQEAVGMSVGESELVESFTAHVHEVPA